MSQDDEDVTCWDCGQYECECHPPTKEEIEAMQKLIPKDKCCERTLLSTLEEIEKLILNEEIKDDMELYFRKRVLKKIEELKRGTENANTKTM